MIYVMSDIHGCYDMYISMLEKINFSEQDTLYILGDVLDRGLNGIKTLLDVATRENVVFLRGNHDHQAGILLSNIHRLENEKEREKLLPAYNMWLSDGGRTTLEEYIALESKEKQKKVIDIIKKSHFFTEIEVNGQMYLLSHTVPEIERLSEYPLWTQDDYMMGEPDYEEMYFTNKILITGHTPTEYIDETSKGRIWKGNHHIAIDCGAAFGDALGCLRLDDMKEFYVST